MLSIVLAAMIVGEPEAAQSALPAPGWARRPSGAEVARVYPKAAIAQSLEGRATLNCSVNIQGKLYDCTTLDEEPAGFGFADAALRMSPLFHMRPVDKEGRPTHGGVVRIPIAFNLPAAEQAPVVIADRRVTNGRVSVSCRLSAQPLLDNCFVREEEPARSGLGALALRIAASTPVPQGQRPVRQPIRVLIPMIFKSVEERPPK